MDRTCSQTLRVPFSTRVFRGNEMFVPIPKSSDMIKRIRLVVENCTEDVTRIVERIELVTKQGCVLERMYGEFIHVENNFKTPAEKTIALDRLLCVNQNGKAYLDIPFRMLENGLFLFKKQDIGVRFVFSEGSDSEIIGYLLVDYYVTDSQPNFPYTQSCSQIQRLSTIVSNASTVTMFTRFVGPVSKVYITVKNTTTGQYIDAIQNVTLMFGEKERFNLTGKYLRFIEPLKRIGIYPKEPMYMYSFSINPLSVAPSGQTHFPENSCFILDMIPNTERYEITIWAESYNFIYFKDDKSVGPMFETSEMLLMVRTTQNDSLNPVPVRISYINYEGRTSIGYSSPYELQVNVTPSGDETTITQNEIIVSGSPVNLEIIFSSPGFDDVTCYAYVYKADVNTYMNRIVYTDEGNMPTFIDGQQIFHVIHGNVFNFSNTIFTSNIQSFVVDENKNYIFTTYTNTSTEIYGHSPFTGPGCVVAKYTQNLELVSVLTCGNANVVISANTYGFYGNEITGQNFPGGKIGAFGKFIISSQTGSDDVFLDSIWGSDTVSGRLASTSSSIFFSDSISSSFGNGTPRAFVMNYSTNQFNIVTNSTAKTAISTDDSAWAFKFTDGSQLLSPPITFSLDGYYVKSKNWNVRINGVSSTPVQDMQLFTGDVFGDVYFLAWYDSGDAPTIVGSPLSIEPASTVGFFVLKISGLTGVVKYALSFLGDSIARVIPLIDKTTGVFMMNITNENGSSPLAIYNDGTLEYNDYGKYQFIIFDDFGNPNSTNPDKNQFFTFSRPLYYNPLYTETYFKQPVVQPPSNKPWIGLVNAPGSNTIIADNHITDKYVYAVTYTDMSSSSNVFDKNGDAGNIFESLSGETKCVFRYTSNCVYDPFWTGSVDNVFDDESVIDENTPVKSRNCIKHDTSVDRVYMSGTKIAGLSSINAGQGIILTTNESLFVVRFDPNNLLSYDYWNMSIENTRGRSITCDGTGNVYVTGIKTVSNQSNIFINGDDIGEFVPSTTSTLSAFVIKINPTSNIVSFCSYVEDIQDILSPVNAIVNGSSVILTSIKNTSASIINGDILKFIPATSNTSGFLVEFDSTTGAFTDWYAHFDGITSNVYNSYMSQSSGEFCICGQFGEKGTFTPVNLYIQNVNITTLNSTQEVTPFVIKFNSDYTYNWHTTIGNNITGNIDSVAIDSGGNVLFSGFKQVTEIDIHDKDGNIIGNIPQTQSECGYFVKMATTGESLQYGYIDTPVDDNATKVSIDKNDNIFISGGTGGKNLYIYDKNGYQATVAGTYIDNRYGYIVKYNANSTLNKISLGI